MNEFEHNKDTPYLALTSGLWGDFGDNFGENWTRFITYYPKDTVWLVIREDSIH